MPLRLKYCSTYMQLSLSRSGARLPDRSGLAGRRSTLKTSSRDASHRSSHLECCRSCSCGGACGRGGNETPSRALVVGVLDHTAACESSPFTYGVGIATEVAQTTLGGTTPQHPPRATKASELAACIAMFSHRGVGKTRGPHIFPFFPSLSNCYQTIFCYRTHRTCP